MNLFKKKKIALLFSLASTFAFSQNTFERTFGDSLSEFAFSAQQTTDKGFIFAGYTNSYGNTGNNFYLVKTDSAANIKWTKVYEGAIRDEAYNIKQTSDGGYIVAGYSKSFGATYFDACLLKTDANGDTLWTKIYGGAEFDYGNTVIQTNDGGYIMAGYTNDTTLAGSAGSIYLVKTDASGNALWQKVLGPANQYTDAYSIKQTPDKGYIMTGYTNGYADVMGDVFLIKTDSTGTPLFTKTYGYKGTDWGDCILQTTDGGYMIAGTRSTDSTGLDVDVFVIKTDVNGDTLWTRSYGGPGNDYGQTIQQTADGGYAIGGYTESFGNGFFDVLLIRTNANGDTLFTRTFGGTGDDEANAIVQSSDGGFVLAGQTASFGKGNYDFYVVKTDSNGNSGCYQNNIHAPSRARNTFVGSPTTFSSAVNLNVQRGNPTLLIGPGVTDACNPVAIKTFSKTNGFTIYPNPGAGIFNLTLKSFPAEVVVTNVLGEIVYDDIVDTFSGRIDISSQPAGTYFIQVTANGKSQTGKILVNK